MTASRQSVSLAAVSSLFSALILAGCSTDRCCPECQSKAKNPSALQSALAQSRGELAPPPDSAIEEVPVVIHSRFEVPPLTPQQKRKYVRRARTLAPQGRSVWFLLVAQNPNGDANVRDYYAPEHADARLRRGQYAFVGDNPLARLLGEISPGARRGENGLKASELKPYCQISLSGSPFSRGLIVPAGTLLPFDPPDDLTDIEIVNLVDFVRSWGTPVDLPPMRSCWPMTEANPSARILEITKEKEAWRVTTGFNEGFLNGQGSFVECVHQDGKYEVVGTGTWVS